MQDFDTTSTQSLIDRYYEEEKAQREIEQTLAALTMRLLVDTLHIQGGIIGAGFDEFRWPRPTPSNLGFRRHRGTQLHTRLRNMYIWPLETPYGPMRA